ncbi:MAG: hypothetical protein LUQ33_03780 [Methanoregulaceae archaeon]|nr:hypothetical protein [Methanoregulaceae archaeon]
MGSYTWRIQIFTAFLGVYFRYLLLGLSWIFGGLCRFLATGWRPVFLWLIISAEIVIIWEIISSVMAETAFSIESVLTSEALGLVIVIFAIGFIIFAGWKARHNVVLSDFVDHTNTQADSKKPGLSSILVIELRRLRDLYQEVDERRPISSLGGRRSLLDYAISVDDTGNLLEKALASETSVKLGPFSVPVGVIAGVAGRIVQGPRISGGFHKDGDLYTLTAQMYGKTAKSWKVEGRLAPKDELFADEMNLTIPRWPDGRVMLSRGTDDSVKTIDPMLRELACRIFTDCTTGGSTRWRATYAFNEGIREYRKTIYSSKDWLLNLKNAEHRFLEAISEDNYFDLAYYNLGVVYTELYERKMNREPAQKAFLSAVKHNPGRWQSYFSLALNRFAMGTDVQSYDRTLLEDVIHHCNQAIALSRGNSKIHDLLGICHRILASQLQYPDNKEQFIKSARNNTIAAGNAWKTICAEEFTIGKESVGAIDDSKKTSWITLWDLAQVLSLPARSDREDTVQDMAPGFWRAFSLYTAEKILLQARFVDRSNALIERELGDIFYTMKKYEKARRSFEAACRIEPTNLQNWSLLALACMKDQEGRNRDQVELALQKVMRNPTDWYTKLSPRWMKEAMEILPKKDPTGRLRKILDFLDKKEGLKKENLDTGNLIIQYDLYTSAEARMEKAITAHEIALQLNANKDYPGAIHYFDQAIGACKENENWEKGIFYNDLAALFFDTGDYPQANESYWQALIHWEKDHSGEITKRALLYNYVMSLLQDEKNKPLALKVANSAYSENPIGYYQLAALGECWKQNNDYVKAQSAFESALLLRPEETEMLIKIGYGYWVMGDYSQELAEKEKYRQKSLTALKNIFPLIDETDVRTKLELSQLIGRCYIDCAEYSKALYYLEIAAAMSTSFYEQTLIYLHQASAYLLKRDHDMSEYWFSKIIEIIQDRMTPNELKAFLPGKMKSEESGGHNSSEPYLFTQLNAFNETYPIGFVYTRALLGKAYSMVERDAGIDQENPESLNLILQAEQAYSFLIDGGLEADKAIESEIDDRKGWINYKLEKLDEAEKYIKRAISLKADPEYHLHLAYVYSSKIGEMKDVEARNVTYRKAIVHSNHAIDMATTNEFQKRAKGLRDAIQVKSLSPGS